MGGAVMVRRGGSWVLVGGLALCALTACASESDAGDPAVDGTPEKESARAPVDPRVLELAAGLALYEENCQICHGRTGLGDGGGGVGLAVKPANIREHFGDHSFDEMVARVVAGIPPAMPAAPISEDEVRLALSYIWSTIPDSAQARLRALQEQAAEEH